MCRPIIYDVFRGYDQWLLKALIVYLHIAFSVRGENI